MKPMRSLFVLFLVLLSGCGTEPARMADPYQPGKGKALIFIYRTDASLETDPFAPDLRVNDRSLGSLVRGGYFRIEVDPGATQVALHAVERGDENTSWPASRAASVKVVATAGGAYFVELSLDTRMVRFRPTSRESALPEISALQLLD